MKAVVDAYKTANRKYVPVVGADNNGFMGQEIDLKDAGLVGINVTNPPAVGGAGLSVALDVLEGKKHPHVIHLTPDGLRQHDARRHGVVEGHITTRRSIQPTRCTAPSSRTRTTPSQQEKACKGPGET